MAAQLGVDCHLNLNFLPRSAQSSDSALRSVVDAAASTGFPVERIILEVTEGEMIDDHAHFAELINAYRPMGMKVAIDDFGAGYSGLNLLADFQPDQLKLDMNLVRGIASRGPREAIVRAILQACLDLGIDVIAEGVETEDEFRWFDDEGVSCFRATCLHGRGLRRCLTSAIPAPRKTTRSVRVIRRRRFARSREKSCRRERARPRCRAVQPTALTMSSTTFFASPNTIMVLSM